MTKKLQFNLQLERLILCVIKKLEKNPLKHHDDRIRKEYNLSGHCIVNQQLTNEWLCGRWSLASFIPFDHWAPSYFHIPSICCFFFFISFHFRFTTKRLCVISMIKTSSSASFISQQAPSSGARDSSCWFSCNRRPPQSDFYKGACIWRVGV